MRKFKWKNSYKTCYMGVHFTTGNIWQIIVQNIVSKCGVCNCASFSYLTFISCRCTSSLTKLTHIYHLDLSYIQNKYHKIITEVTDQFFFYSVLFHSQQTMPVNKRLHSRDKIYYHLVLHQIYITHKDTKNKSCTS
jgi:hypothetical protein